MNISEKDKGSPKRTEADAPLAIAPLLIFSPSQPFQDSAQVLREMLVPTKPEKKGSPAQGSLLYDASPVIWGDTVLSVVL